MVRTCVVLMLTAMVLASCVTGQLNFSPGWGKRAGGVAVGGGGGVSDPAALHSASQAALAAVSPNAAGDNCGTIPVSAVMHIYRLIRAEAARLVQCQEEEYMG
nr:red pigment-concentrating hormone-like [Procambarus clarkii]